MVAALKSQGLPSLSSCFPSYVLLFSSQNCSDKKYALNLLPSFVSLCFHFFYKILYYFVAWKYKYKVQVKICDIYFSNFLEYFLYF